MDKIRLKFLAGEQKEFLKEVYKKSDLSNRELARIANIHVRSFNDWKREKLSITVEAADNFCKICNINLPEDREVMIKRYVDYKKEISKKGGLALFKKHGSPATKEGCQKGGRKTLTILRQRGLIPQRNYYSFPVGYTKELAEYVGILLGDGGIGKEQSTVTLNSEADSDYIKYVFKVGEKLFKKGPKLHKRIGCKAIVLYYNSTLMVKYLISIGLKIGNKVKQQVDVPEWIKNNKKYKILCLRGLMDTDGGIFLHKYKVRGKEYVYKKICFTNRSIPLLLFVKKTLGELGLTPKLVDNVANMKVWLYNSEEVNQYLKLVGSSNQRLLKYFSKEECDSWSIRGDC